MTAKQILSRLKPYLRWLILSATLFFVVGTLRKHWAEVVSLRVEPAGWACLSMALGVTLVAHIWSGWVWSLILRELNQPVSGVWSVLVYLQTNIAKYLPGNVWHFYGRVMAAKNAGIPIGAATLSVLLEPLLMAAAALTIALSSRAQEQWLLQALILAGILIAIHPLVMNPLLKVVGRSKTKSLSTQPDHPQDIPHPEDQSPFPSLPLPPSPSPSSPVLLKRYPLLPFLGELLFVLLRGTGFLLTLLAFSPLSPGQIPSILSAFSFAWLLGLVIPGAPGGLGVFEATVIALLRNQLTPGLILGGVAFYRLVSTLAEAGGAGLAWLDARGNGSEGETRGHGDTGKFRA